ncbi:MAG TPA: hypothetical protein VJT31_35010 [Rugosimonospora sp.]|nr:hypothetical protein [Rugosimonospora sp.]
MAVLNGWRGGAWRGPAVMARWQSPLVSYWNPILAQGSGRVGVREWIDHDQHTADAVLGGFKPYGYLQCTPSQAEQLTQRAAAAPFDVVVSGYEPDPQAEGTGWVTVARADTLGDLFPNLGGLIDAYQVALPAEVFEREVLPLHDATGVSPADFLDDFLALENGPDPLLGLVLGYPPLVTAGAMLRKVPGWWVECGSLPPRHWPPDAPLTTGSAAEFNAG